MLISRVSMVAGRLIAVCAALCMSSLAWGQTDNWDRTDNDGPCSNRTLRGDYGYAAAGVLIGAPGLPREAQFRSVGVTHFDGRGKLTWVEHTVVNGILLSPGWVAASGTYTVNPNCTGTAVVNTPNSPVPLNLALVVIKEGKEIHTVLDTDAVSSVFTKIE
jgi:hypothetical protein